MTDDDKSTSPPDDARFEVKWRKKNEPTSPPPPPTEAGETEDVEVLRRQLAQEEEHVRTLQDRWQRAAADLANLRRRTEQERGEMEKFASMMLVAELLPVLDNFGRALQTIPGNLEQLTWIQGVMLIERHLRAILEHQGVEPIAAVGERFNPALHEAAAERTASDVAPGTVLQEYQTGYTMHGRVLRPSLVEVAAAPQDSGSTGPEQTTEAQAEEISADAQTQNSGP